MYITFRQMQLFLALAESGSVSAAARRLNITQPTASAQLKEISISVGLPVYEVVSKRVILTDLGRELANAARRISNEWDRFTQIRDATRGLHHGRLRIAAVSTAKYFIPRMVGNFCKRHPSIDVSLEILNRDGVLRRLRENLDEIYIMSMPPADMELEDQVFMDNPLFIIAAKNSPYAGMARLSISDLRGERFILREPGSGTRIATDRHFDQVRFRPQVRLELGSNEAIKEAVAGGLGIGVVSTHAIEKGSTRSGIVKLDVRGLPIASSWHVVYPAHRVLSPIAEAFKLELLKSKRINRIRS